MAEDIVDFLIIGAGPSGAATTWSLSYRDSNYVHGARGLDETSRLSFKF